MKIFRDLGIYLNGMNIDILSPKLVGDSGFQ